MNKCYVALMGIVLIAVLFEEALKDENSIVRSYAADALQKIGTTNAYEILKKYKSSGK